MKDDYDTIRSHDESLWGDSTRHHHPGEIQRRHSRALVAHSSFKPKQINRRKEILTAKQYINQ